MVFNSFAAYGQFVHDEIGPVVYILFKRHTKKNAAFLKGSQNKSVTRFYHSILGLEMLNLGTGHYLPGGRATKASCPLVWPGMLTQGILKKLH